MKNKYVPFLKLKVNEIAALSVLDEPIKEKITPFFDLPKEEKETPEKLGDKISKSARSVSKNLKKLPQFYLDNFDITDSILIDGRHNYFFVINEFRNTPFIPVIGIDRKKEHNTAVFQGKKNGLIKSATVAIRLQPADFATYELVSSEIDDLFDLGENVFTEWDLILDNRVCLKVDVTQRANELIAFITKALGDYNLRRVIITGSSIPSSIGEIIKTDSTLDHHRVELAIFNIVKDAIHRPELILGDYTVVSPLYSDLKIAPEAMRNVTAPKIAYSYGNVHFIMRGISLASHPLGNLQYNQLAAILITKTFFRPIVYSFGENFLSEKSKSIGKQVTPGSILKPTISTHITYMSRDYPS